MYAFFFPGMPHQDVHPDVHPDVQFVMLILSGPTLPPPPIALQGIAIPIASTFFRVSQGIALYPPPPNYVDGGYRTILLMFFGLKALGGGVSQVKAVSLRYRAL